MQRFEPIALERAEVVGIAKLDPQLLEDRPEALARRRAVVAGEMVAHVRLEAVVIQQRVIDVEKKDIFLHIRHVYHLCAGSGAAELAPTRGSPQTRIDRRRLTPAHVWTQISRSLSMANAEMLAQMSGKPGFIAALDQSGGSTPGALRLYGIPDSAYSGDAEMFAAMHAMRVRMMTAPAFTGAKVIAAILFEAHDGRRGEGVAGSDLPVERARRRAVAEGRQGPRGGGRRGQSDEADPRAAGAARSRDRARHIRHQDALHHPPCFADRHRRDRRAAVRDRRRDRQRGLVPIIEPEVSINSPDKAGRRDIAARRDPRRARQAAGGPEGDAQADDSRRRRTFTRR